jgi:hypothetical protein
MNACNARKLLHYSGNTKLPHSNSTTTTTTTTTGGEKDYA